LTLDQILLEQKFYDPSSDESYLYQALVEATKGLSTSSPNPSVGCVIVSAQRTVLAMGHHKLAGQPHAEIIALSKIAPVTLSQDGSQWNFQPEHLQALQGATIYVTLEPCAHKGRTPSCAELLSKLPIKRLVALLKDPNPLVSGKGFELLSHKAIEVSCFEQVFGRSHPLVMEALRIHRSFLFSIKNGRPLFTLKVAQSLDGYIGLQSGESKWITSEHTRRVAHSLRAIHDCIMTGKGTVLSDNPFLDLRNTQNPKKKLPLYIWDSGLELLMNYKLNIYQSRSSTEVLLISQSVEQKKGYQIKFGQDYKSCATELRQIRVLLISLDPELAFEGLCDYMRQEGIQSVWIEGGAQISSFMIENRMVDQVVIFMGNNLLGYQNGLSWTKNIRTSRLQDSVKLNVEVVKRLASDCLLIATL